MASTSQRPRQEMWLRVYAKQYNITRACLKSRIPRETLYGWRKDPEFEAKLQAVKFDITDALEDATVDAALGEWDEKKGKYVKGDTMLKMFLLNAQKPEVYKRKVEVSGNLTISDLVLGDAK